jgi:hypothetical protein
MTCSSKNSKIVQCGMRINLIFDYANYPYRGYRFCCYIRHCYLERKEASICKHCVYTYRTRDENIRKTGHFLFELKIRRKQKGMGKESPENGLHSHS